MEVEAVCDARRDRERGGRVRGELDDRAQPLGLGAFAEVVERDRSPSDDDRQVVRVPPVGMHAAENVGLRPDRVPLHRCDGELPRVTKELREDAARVGVRVEPMEVDAVGEHSGIMSVAPG